MQIDIKCTLDRTFLDCLALTLCDNVGDLLLNGLGLGFRLRSNLADSPVSRVRIIIQSMPITSVRRS